MGINPRERDNMFLAKVAGEDVDFSTISPSEPRSDREKLLMKIDDRITAANENAGSGVEIVNIVLTMEPSQGAPVVSVSSADKTITEISEGMASGKQYVAVIDALNTMLVRKVVGFFDINIAGVVSATGFSATIQNDIAGISALSVKGTVNNGEDVWEWFLNNITLA